MAAFFCFWDYNLDKIRKRVNSLTHPLLLAIIYIMCVCIQNSLDSYSNAGDNGAYIYKWYTATGENKIGKHV